MDRYKALSDQLHKSDERTQQIHDRNQVLEKENS
jgi:hypothetical protein